MKKENNNEYKPIIEDYTPVDLGAGGVTAPQRSNVGIYIAVILILVFIIVILIANIGKLNNKYNDLGKYAMQLENQLATASEPSAETTTTTISKTETIAESEQTTTEPVYEAEYKIEYISHKLDYDSENNPVLLVTYNFTNTSDDNMSWAWDVRDKVFQNGVECGGYAYHEEANTQMQLNEIRPGTTVEIIECYPLYDNTNNVTLEFYEFLEDVPLTVYEIELGA